MASAEASAAESKPEKRKQAPPMSAAKKAEIAEDMAEAMINGWSFVEQREWRRNLQDQYGITRSTVTVIERMARDILTDSFDEVSRKDLVARNLHRLERLTAEAMKYKQSGIAQACIATALRAVGADAPPKQKD